MAKSQVTSPPDAQLDFDDGDLKAIATVYLEEGNKEYRRKEASNALSFYTQGIQINCKDDVLNAKLYSNRATAHFYLGNFQETLHDATAAVTLKPTFIKAIEKGASACVKLKRYEEAMTWCDKGLAIDNNKKTLVDLRTKCLNEPDSLQETKQQNMKILPVSGIATGQNGTDSIPRTIGNACDSLKDVKTAFDYHQCHLKTAIEVGDRAGEGIAHHNLGVIAFEHLGDLKTAIYHLERHLEIAKEVGEKTGEGSAHHNLGNAYRILGDIKKALYHHERGHEIAKEAGNKGAEGITLNGIGLAYSSQGKFKPAIDHYERSLNIAIEVGDKALEGKVYCNLGIAYRSLGKFERAIDSYERSIKLARDVGDKAGEGIAYGNLGNVYLELEEFETAIDYHKRGLKIAKEIGNKVGEGNICNTIGAAYLKRGLEIAKEERDKVGEGNVCRSIGAAYQSRGYFNTAKDYFERHLKIAREVGDKAGEGMAYCGLGNAYKGLNDFKAAIDYQERGLEISKEVGNNAVTATLFCMLGTSYELQQSLARAQECYHSSVRMFNIVRHDLKGKDEWKISYRNKCETAYTGLWRVLINQGKKEKSLLAADQGRAQALNDLMESNYGLPTTHFHLDDPEESTCNSFSFPRSVTVFIATDDKDIVFWVVQEGKEVKWDYRKHEYISLNLNEFFKSLIMTARQEIGARACVKCENRSLDKLGDEQVANESTITPVPLQMSALRTLYDIIINPIARLLHGDELIFVPQGPLCLAPFAALMDSNSRYLCDARRIRVIPSLISLKMITDSPDSYHSKTGVLLVGDPWVQEVVIPGINLEQLKYARKEVQMIGRIFNTKPLIGREATKNEVLRRLPSVALIHIAAHGAAGTGEIALAPNITRASQIPANEDFLLTMKDVTSAQLRARLVVLSCCHSGRGEIKAEGVVGIARAFLGAGARAVLVSLWAIDDEATLEFMKSFYSHLIKGISASESLNNAMKHMRESDEFNEVKHWAPFVLIGDDVTLELGGSE